MNGPLSPESLIVNAMLCDYAQVHAERLFAIGAGTTFAQSPSTAQPYVIHLWLAMVVTLPWHELGAPHRLAVELSDESGPRYTRSEAEPVFEAEFNVTAPRLARAGDDVSVPVAIPLVRSLPTLGPWAVVIQFRRKEAQRLRFRVIPGTPMPILPGRQQTR